MPKDLLAELQLPKLDLKSLQNIITRNSTRLACVIQENNEFLVKSKTIPSGFKVIVGASVSDVNFPFSIPSENVKTIKREFTNDINKNSHIDGLKKSSSSLTNGTTVSTNLVLELNTHENDKIKCAEIKPEPATRGNWNSSVTADDVSNLDTTHLPQSNACIGTNSLMGSVARSPGHEDVEIEVLLDNTSKKRSDSNTRNLNSFRLTSVITTAKPSVDSSIGDSLVSSTKKYSETVRNFEESSDPALCVISEVIGNADAAFSDLDEHHESEEEVPETQLITPKKTNDITKIKGWRRKQFFVEKPTTVEFYSSSSRSASLTKKIVSSTDGGLIEEQGNKENAFVSDSLDEFLDQEAELKIGYEIPHLFAEFGIKLTSDEIFSKPNLSEQDLKEVETRYSVPISLPPCDSNLDEIKEESTKRVKRPIEEEIKPSKTLKLDECKKQSVWFVQNQKEKSKSDLQINFADSQRAVEVDNLQKNMCQLSRSDNNLNNIKFLSKLIALVVYPNPFTPLHPVVQYHLDKIRSYRTAVDKNWANFAASAVVVNDRRFKRKILPAHCCVKIKEDPANTVKSETEKIDQSESKKKVTKTVNNDKIKPKQCSVVIKRLQPHLLGEPWCMEHNCYRCTQCGLGKKITAQSQVLSERKSVKTIKNVEKEEEEQTVTVSPRASFNRKIARLLAKKVRLLRVNGDTLTSIDCLRILTRDTIEFIKLKFIKESFLAGHVNIWYLKPGTAAARSRAFLTFSNNSPVPEAINLKSLSINNLPKVITEIVSAENTCDANEYAILHCNGGLWEIHGSLNITFGKSDRNVEQIFTSLDLPELKKLQDIAEEILHVKAVKWWVLDLTQKFRLVELKSGNISTVVTRSKFSEVIELNSYGFIPLRKDFENRVLGAYIVQRLLPFVLIGPYYLLETRDMILKGASSTVPFKYYGEENVTTNYPLKFFINSVIKNLEKSSKQLEGLWLYDKMCLDKTSYIEVVTTNVGSPLPERCSAVDIEHGYSLNSLTNSSPSGATSGIIKRDDGKDELQTVTVYLYFDIFDLGYIEGELQFDNSVIINHPLDERTKMKSHKIGDWFVSIIKRRIEFIPKDLAVRWFITKYKDDLRGRLPFNKFILGGAHIITKYGVHYLLEMTESKIEKLGLHKNEIVKVMSQCQVLREVKELKNLASLFLNNATRSLSMDKVLDMAINEIKLLRVEEIDLENKKRLAEQEKLNLGLNFIKLVNDFRIRYPHKIKMIKSIDYLFRTANGELSRDFVKKLKNARIGWKYLKHLKRWGGPLNKIEAAKKWRGGKLLGKSSKKVEFIIRSLQRLSKSYLVHKPEMKLLNSPDVIVGNPSAKTQIQIPRLSSFSDQLNAIKIKPHKNSFKNSSSVKKDESRILTPQKSENNCTQKDEGFLKLASTPLPKNKNLSWNRCKANNLEVA